MTLQVVALESKTLKSRYLRLNDERPAHARTRAMADSILKSCLEECLTAGFSGNLTVLSKSMFDSWGEDLPDLRLLKNCQSFLSDLQRPGSQQGVLPWWIKNSSIEAALVQNEALKQFLREAHESKFFEFLLANIVTGESAPQFIRLGEFLDLACKSGCGLLCWKGPRVL